MAFGITSFAEAPFASESGSNANVAVTGIQLNTAIGNTTVTAGAVVNLIGIPLTSSVDDVTINLNTPVNVTGEDLTLSLGNEI